MAETITLGIVGIKNMGEYDSQTNYEKLNVVTYQGSTYCALQETKGNLPTDTDYWQLYAEKGGTGSQGPQGPQGPIGPKGDTGNPGASPVVVTSSEGMTDTTKIYVLSTDGHWYWYDTNNTQWTDGGVYQASSFPDLDAIKTGYDSTQYITPEKAVNSQFKGIDYRLNDLVLKKTDNLFNIPLRSYYSINNSTGVQSFSSSNVNTACTIDFIEVKPSTEYILDKTVDYNASATVFEYDENQNFIQTVSNKVFTTNENTKYIKIKYNKTSSTEEIPIMLNNHVLLIECKYSNQAYQKRIPNFEVKNIGGDEIDDYNIKDNSISLEKMKYFKRDNTINLMPYYRFIPYSNIDNTTGEYYERVENINSCTNPKYIEVSANSNYSFNAQYGYDFSLFWHWYDSDYNFLSIGSGKSVTSPVNAKYVRLRAYSSNKGVDMALNMSHIILSKTSSKISYTPAFELSDDILPKTNVEEKNIKNIINSKRENFIKINKTKKLLNFAMCTDTHLYDTTGDQSGLLDIKVVNEIGKENWIDFAVHGGDIFNAYLEGSVTGSQGITHEEAIKRIDDALTGFKDVKVPIYIARGNHDINNKYKPGYPDDTTIDSTQNITKPEFYMLAQNNFAQEVDNRFELNFYKDYKDLKIRIITLDVYSSMSESANFTHASLDWLANTALKVPADYTCMIICHTVEGTAGNILQSLISEYKNGGIYTNNTLNVTADYTSQGARTFVGCICGHSHGEGDSISLGFWNITSGTSYLKTDSDINNNIFASVFTVDPDNHLLYKQKVGANGYNKIYDYVNLTATDISE